MTVPSRSLLIQDAEVDGRRVDVVVRGRRVVAITDTGTTAHRALARIDARFDAGGGVLLPGLTDHHLHLLALDAARRSVHSPGDRSRLAAAVAAATPDRYGWVRVVGHPRDDLDAGVLDGLAPGRPVRVQHRSGAQWTLNSAGLDALAAAGPLDHPGIERDAAGTPTGRIVRADGWLRGRLPGPGAPDLAGLGRVLARFGITAVTDATPDLDAHTPDVLAALPQRLTLLGLPLGRAAPRGVATGPHKIVLPDLDRIGLDELVGSIAAAHAVGRAVAVHTVTRASLVLLLTALDVAGRHPGDRIEHAASVPAELVPRLRGLTVVTQPGFLADRGDDYRRDVPADEHADLYRCRSLREAGARVAVSSDAPYGPLDPWAVVRAAMQRRTPAGERLSPDEALSAGDALRGYLSPAGDPGGPVARVAVGAPAELVLLHVPAAAMLRAPSADLVRATVLPARDEQARGLPWVIGS